MPDAILLQMPSIGTRLRRITPDGKIHLIAGDGTHVLADPSSDESMIYLFLLAFDHDGRLIIADSALDQIKRLEPGTFTPMSGSPRRLALLGGTFDPIDAGHLAAGRAVLDQGLADEVVFVPAGQPPHKPAGPRAGSDTAG